MKKIELNIDLDRESGLNSVPTGVGYYPEFSFTEDKPCDIPEEGELTVKYRLVRHAVDTTNEDKPRYSYTVCVKELISAVGEKEPSVNEYKDEAGDALDALVAEKAKEKSEDY